MIVKKYIKLILLVLFCLQSSASPIDISKNSKEVLAKSYILLENSKSDISQIRKNKNFKACKNADINVGLKRHSFLWIKLILTNPTNKTVSRYLQIRNPLLESVTLYDDDKSLKKGVLSLKNPRNKLHTFFKITLRPMKQKVYYIEVGNKTTTLRLGIHLKDIFTLLKDEYREKSTLYIFFTILSLILFYNIVLYIYTKEIVYMYYGFYLFALIFQQATYLGVTQIFSPVWFILFDNLAVVFKVNLMYITAIFFVREFLQTKKYPKIDKIYKAFLYIAIVEIPLFGFPEFYHPEIAIFTALVFIYFNLFAGFYIYKQGYKQARLFILGWSVQVIGFTIMILDGLGYISIMYDIPNLVICLTSIEALILSIAFIDRYIILKKEKELTDQKLMQELKDRNKIIQEEIAKATIQLNQSLKNEKNLLQELHHRSKNIMQLILSLVRMQSDDLKLEDKWRCLNLENRINAISKTYEMLFIKNDLEEIDVAEYVEELCEDLENISSKEITFTIDIKKLYLPIKYAIHIGLIVNELITNSIKYVDFENISISISIKKSKEEIVFVYQDSGSIDKDILNEQNSGLGLKLVKTIVQNQLEGDIILQKTKPLSYLIRFKI